MLVNFCFLQDILDLTPPFPHSLGSQASPVVPTFVPNLPPPRAILLLVKVAVETSMDSVSLVLLAAHPLMWVQPSQQCAVVDRLILN